MTTETQTPEASQPTTVEVKDLNEPSLTLDEYTTIRRGGTVKKEVSNSALEATAPEHKKEASESETAAKEEDAEGEHLDRESLEDTESKEQANAEDKKPKKGGIQKRFDKMTREKVELEREREYWRQQALKASSPSTTVETPKTAPKVDEGKPTPEKFENHSDYVEALTDWKTDQKLKERDEKASKERVISEQQKIAQTYQDKLVAFKEKTPDFNDVESELDDALAQAGVGPSPAMSQAFLTAENGPELAYELAKEPKEFVRICKLDPFRAAVELGKFAAKLEAKSSQSQEPKKLTNAPKPLEPVGTGKGTAVAKSIADPDISFAEYVKLRREQTKRRA